MLYPDLMTTAMKILAMAVLFCPPLSHASTAAAKWDIAVKFDNSFYNLRYDGKSFTYRESPVVYTFAVKSCNRAQVDRMAARYQALLKKYHSAPARSQTKYDVHLDARGKKLSIARGSPLGTWLRTLPQKMMYFNAEARTSCRR
jgi:hypothetical protein